MSSESSDVTRPEPQMGEVPPPAGTGPNRKPYVFWRRIAALLLDGLVLGLIGLLAGSLLFDWFSDLGHAGRIVGFIVALIYFGILNSTLGGGQTLGKRIMKIEVVDHSGCHVLPLKSSLRFLILGLPFFINGAVTGPPLAVDVAIVIIFGGGGTLVYLFLFNGKTRQSLHDLACGTFVVEKARAEATPIPTIWRGHLVIAAALFVVVLAAPALIPRVKNTGAFPELLALRKRILATDRFSDAGVFRGKNWTLATGARQETAYLAVTVRLKRRPSEFESSAAQVASLVLATYPESKQQDFLVVTAGYGYDIGIARAWISRRFQRSPAEWEQKIAPAKAR
jgi:uncharacterized RDD family membrane protein YckC